MLERWNAGSINMGEPLAKKLYYSKEEYLEMEAAAEYKSEYFQGKIFPISGITPKHSVICFNLNGAIWEATHHKDCIGFESNMKLEIAEADAYVYPDLMVVCGDVKLAENTTDVITNPMLIIEVLSPGTEAFDRGKKFEYYRSVESLKEYVLVSQDKPRVEAYFRKDRNNWQYTVITGIDKSIVFNSLDYEVKLEEIYYKTEMI
jgi:Uma2 family endonuclease